MQTPPILIYGLCYVMVFILSLISKKESSQRLFKDDGSVSDKPGNILGLHIIGILWLGMVPAFTLELPVLKTFTGSSLPNSYIIITFLMLLLLVAALAVKTAKNIQQKNADSGLITYKPPVVFITRYFIIRTTFLLAYELFLRGFVLFYSIDIMGITLAVIVNVLLHTLLHLFNSKKEMLACIPYSLLVCWLCIICNAVWPAVVLHITFSLVYEINLYKSIFSAPKIAQS